jgi:hypothetical protein
VLTKDQDEKRKVEVERVGWGEVEGSVWWEGGGDQGKKRGCVEVGTTFAPVTLRL